MSKNSAYGILTGAEYASYSTRLIFIYKLSMLKFHPNSTKASIVHPSSCAKGYKKCAPSVINF